MGGGGRRLIVSISRGVGVGCELGLEGGGLEDVGWWTEKAQICLSVVWILSWLFSTS